jgi:Protein of unknown function (DUF1559)
MRRYMRAGGIVAVLAATGLALPTASSAATRGFRVPVPKADQVVFVSVSGRARLPGLPSLTLETPSRVKGAAVASSLWRQRPATKRFEGIIVLVDRPVTPSRSHALARTRAIFALNGVLVQPAIAHVAILAANLLPYAQRVREAAARAACSNNLRNIGVAAHRYHDAGRHFVGPFAFNRHACAAFFDETIPGGPVFWAHHDHAYCGLRVVQVGSMREGRISGSCNYDLGSIVIRVPSSQQVTGCLPFTGADDCVVSGHEAESSWPTRWRAYDPFAGNVRVDAPLNGFKRWRAELSDPDGRSLVFPTDPTKRDRIFK